MNRTQLHNPKQADQATLEQAVRLLVESIGKDADPVSAVRSVLSTICMNDIAAERDISATLNELGKIAFGIQDEAFGLWAAYTDAEMELQDNPDSLSLLRDPSAGAGACDGDGSSLHPSLDALPPAVREHLARRYIRCSDRRALGRMDADGDGLLARALLAEVATRNAIASENADAASNCLVVAHLVADSKPLPLVSLGQGEYRREIGGEA